MHDTSTPHRSETNGVVERAIRRVKEGTSCTLIQSGWYPTFWPEAMACYCFLRNVSDVLHNGHIAYYSRYNSDFQVPLIPFGAQIEYKPMSEKDLEKLHTYGRKVLSGIFMGYHQKAGGAWNGDILIADWEEIENLESPRDIHLKQIPFAQTFVSKENEQFRFSLFFWRISTTRGHPKRI